MMIFAYLLIGAIAGLLTGLVGVGGGIFVIPLLISIFHAIKIPDHLIMHFAAGTSLAVMVITTGSSVRTHLRYGNKIWPIFKTLVPGLIVGCISGATIADFMPSRYIEMLFSILLLVVSYRAFFVKTIPSTETIPSVKKNMIVGYGIGTLSGLLGIGGGVVVAPYLLHQRVPIRLAVAVSAACGMLVASVGSITYMITGANELQLPHWTSGYIYWPAFFGIALTSPIFANLGARLSHKIPTDILQKFFAGLTLLMAIKMLVFDIFFQ